MTIIYKPDSGNSQLLTDTRDFVLEVLAEQGLSLPAEKIKINEPACADEFSVGIDNGFYYPTGREDIMLLPSYDMTWRSTDRIFHVVTLPSRCKAQRKLAKEHTEACFRHQIVDITDPRPVVLYAPANIETTNVRAVQHLKEVREYIESNDYRLVIATAPRTQPFAETLIKLHLGDIAERAFYYRDENNGDSNPYVYYLDRAEIIIASGDSLSMMSDAINAEKSVLIATGLSRPKQECIYMINGLQRRNITMHFTPDADVSLLSPIDETITGWAAARAGVARIAKAKLQPALP